MQERTVPCKSAICDTVATLAIPIHYDLIGSRLHMMARGLIDMHFMLW